MSSAFEPPPPPPAYRGADTAGVVTGNNGKATASMICGIVGLVLFGIILGPIAIALGVQARNEIRNTGQSGSGMATAGIVLGIIDVAFFFLVILLIV